MSESDCGDAAEEHLEAAVAEVAHDDRALFRVDRRGLAVAFLDDVASSNALFTEAVTEPAAGLGRFLRAPLRAKTRPPTLGEAEACRADSRDGWRSSEATGPAWGSCCR